MTFQSLTGKLPFIGADDVEYSLTPLTLSLFGDFVTWVQYKPYRDALTADLPAKICKDLLKECQTGLVEEEISDNVFKKLPINLNSTVVNKQLQVTEGITKFLHLSLITNHPEFKDIEKLNTIISDDVENLADIYKPLLRLNGLLDAEEKEENTEKNQQGLNQATT